MTEPENVIELRDVGMAFGAHRVFEQLQLAIRKGEVLTLLGGSGCGKSVLLKIILRLVQWQSGQVLIEGEDISRYGEDQMLPIRQKVGMVFQGGALFDSLTVYENIAYSLRERRIRDEPRIAERVATVLQMVGLPGIESKMPAELSGGMRKRVALARAIAQEPRVLLYDEPTTGLDPINVRRVSELIVQLNRELSITSVVVTHDLPSAYLISDRMAMIADKHILAIATPEAMRKSENPLVSEFLTAMDFDPSRAA
jgi:phospholipid/cholesterol/gamma-HCH transport system ATP-binding protein